MNEIETIWETRVKLLNEIIYEETENVFHIVCPTGFTADLKRSWSNGCIELQLLQELNAEVTIISRLKTKSKFTLPGLRLFMLDANTIAYRSEGHTKAKSNWVKKLKPKLIELGIEYEKPPVCLPYTPKKDFNDCKFDNITNPKWSKNKTD